MADGERKAQPGNDVGGFSSGLMSTAATAGVAAAAVGVRVLIKLLISASLLSLLYILVTYVTY